MMSNDPLENGEEQISGDITHFFFSKKRINLMYMWEAGDFFLEAEIDILTHKSLIKAFYPDRILMHRQSRDRGRIIVRRKNNGKPGDRNRLLEMAQGRV